MAEELFVDLPRFTTLYWTVVPKTASVPVATQRRTVKAARKLNVAGQWEFEDGTGSGTGNGSELLTKLGKATVGNDLVITENNTTILGGWTADPPDIYAIDGPSAMNKAIFKGKGGIMEWELPIAWTPKSGEQRINEYTLVFDIRKSTDGWRSFTQWYNEVLPSDQTESAIKNSNGELFVHATRVGTELGYSGGAGVINNVWHRVIFSMNLGVEVSYYIDGVRTTSTSSAPADGYTVPSSKDGRWSLPVNGKIWFFQDGVTNPDTTLEHEDWILDVAEIIVYKEALTDAEVTWLESKKDWNYE